MTSLDTSAYNPRQMATDGPFTAPRVWQHVLKALVGLAVTAAVLALMICAHTYRVDAVLVGVGIELVAVIKETLWPSDPAPHTWREHALDWLTDTACYSAGAPLVLVALAQPMAAVITLVALFTIYRLCRHGARP